MHEVLVNRLGGLSLPRKSVVRLIDRPEMTLDVYRGRKTTTQHNMAVNSFGTAFHAITAIKHCFPIHQRLPGPSAAVENSC